MYESGARGANAQVIVVSLAIELPNNDHLKWWGNEIVRTTADFHRTPLRHPPVGGIPKPGTSPPWADPNHPV